MVGLRQAAKGGDEFGAQGGLGLRAEAEKRFFEDGAGRFAETQEAGEVFGEAVLVVGGGIEPHQFGEGHFVAGIELNRMIDELAREARQAE